MMPTATASAAVPVGIAGLDRTVPLNRGAFYLVGGASVMGRTTFAVSAAIGAARKGSRVCFIAARESRFAVERSLAGALAGATLRPLAPGLVDPDELREKLEQGMEELRSLPIEVKAEALPSIREIHGWLRPAGRADLVVIDDLQDVSRVEGEDVGACLAWLARWLRVPVVATLKTDLPERSDAFPLLSDLPQALVRSADVSMMLHRPCYFEAWPFEVSAREQRVWGQGAQCVVLRDAQGLWRGFSMALEHERGPVFV